MPTTHIGGDLIESLRELDDLYQGGGLATSEFKACKDAAIAAEEAQYRLMPVENLEVPLQELRTLNSEGIISEEEWAMARHFILVHARSATDVIGALTVVRRYGREDLISLYDYDQAKLALLGIDVATPTIQFSSTGVPGANEKAIVDFIVENVEIPEIPYVAGTYEVTIAGVNQLWTYNGVSDLWERSAGASTITITNVELAALYSSHGGTYLETIQFQAGRPGSITMQEIVENYRKYSQHEFSLILAEFNRVLNDPTLPADLFYLVTRILTYFTYT